MSAQAFSRAKAFLQFNPVARVSAILGSIATAFLYVLLLVLLAFFVDLILHHGRIPTFSELAPGDRARFLDRVAWPEDPDAKKTRADEMRGELREVGIDEKSLTQWWSGKSSREIPYREQATLWMLNLAPTLDRKVGVSAGSLIRNRLKERIEQRGWEDGIHWPIEDVGMLSLVARSTGTWRGWALEPLASFNTWMWKYGNQAYLFGLFGFALFLGLARAGFHFLAQWAAAQAVVEAITRLRRAIYHQTNRLGILAFRALGPSEAVGISTRQLEGVHEGLYLWLTTFFREPVKLGLLLGFALAVHFWLALAFLLFAVLVWLAGGQIAAHFRRQGRIAEIKAAEQLSLMQESLMIMRLVKIYLMEGFNQARVERQLAAYGNAQLIRYRGEAIYRPAFAFLGFLASLFLLLVIGSVVLRGDLGVTSIVVLVTAMVSMYWPIVRILEIRRHLRRAKGNAEVLFQFLDRQGGVGQAIEAEFLPPLGTAIEFDKVALKEAGTGKKILRGVSFSILAGQKVAFVGPDEMEKHALVYLLPRFLDPNQGEIRFDQRNLRWVTLDSLRAQIAMVLQHNLVFSDTVANNIGCGDPAYSLPKVIEAAKLAHAHQFIHSLPKGYETQVGDNGHPLDAGQKFRLALARAILRDPAILVIEEPQVSLDQETKDLLDDTFNRFLPGRTVVFLPRRLSTIRNCDQVFLLNEGQIVDNGDHKDLLDRNDLYRHLQYLEFNEFAATTNHSRVPIESGA